MKKTNIILLAVIICISAILNTTLAQQFAPSEPPIVGYRQTPIKINALVHTKLAVSFDYKKCYLYGKEWITLHPYFYPTDSLRLDAKGMDIKNISIINKGKNIPLQYGYDGLTINIKLDRVYTNAEDYVVYIDYLAKPNELNVPDNAKGLYFVNPDSTDKNKPVQIWTEGEPEGSSCWFPTIDKPNQKTTQEIAMTVPAKYVTLSNGKLASQKVNADGTRTDTWQMQQPNAPYLFMMAVGDFRIYKDSWHGKEVDYYLEPKYAPYAKEIFGEIPEAIGFFSKVTGVDYPWDKCAEIVVRDYISGAMENTSATVFGEPIQGTKRELVDRYYNPGMEHELFHQWFGDYVTTESWSNVTLNESFADFGEIIWLEHKYGKDVAGEHVYQGLQEYLGNDDAKTKSLVNFNYEKIKDAFGVTYRKGGRILNMLRNYLGDAAFYKGLHIYLTTNAFKSAEAQQLRLAMEDASGLDLNWFFNQWYYGASHPQLNITYKWDEVAKTETVYLRQTQNGGAFVLPMAIDVYVGGSKERHNIWMTNKTDTLTFTTNVKPALVNVDADKVLVAQKNDDKTLDEYVYQYFNGPLYTDRREAFEAALKSLDDTSAKKIIIAALEDKFSGLRMNAILALNSKKEDIRNINADLRNAALPILLHIAKNESNTVVRAAAINTLSVFKDSTYMPLFVQALNSESYTVQGAALRGISEINPMVGIQYAKGFENDNSGDLTQAIVRVYTTEGGAKEWPFVYSRFNNGTLQEKIHLVSKFSEMVSRMDNPVFVTQGVETLTALAIKYKSAGAAPYISNFLNRCKDVKAKANDVASVKMIEDGLKQIDSAK